MMGIKYARESLVDVWDEAQPLLLDHWTEIAFFDDIPLEPRYAVYAGLEAAGALRIFTARAAGVLVGYAAYAVAHALHYASSVQANCDVLFLHPNFRHAGIGGAFITFAEDQLRADGAQLVTQRVKLSLDFGPLLDAIGYAPMERVHVKRLDRAPGG